MIVFITINNVFCFRVIKFNDDLPLNNVYIFSINDLRANVYVYQYIWLIKIRVLLSLINHVL